MRDGFKIVDTDCHMMEPEWLWERYMEDAYKSQAPKIGQRARIGTADLPGRRRLVHARKG